MSIIYDALKKVGQKVEISNDPAPMSAAAPLQKARNSQFKGYLVIIGVLITGVAGASFVFRLIESVYKKNVAGPSSPIAVVQPQASITLSKGQAQDIQEALKVEVTAPAPKIENLVVPSFVLNGIFFSENKGYALINNQIAKVGDLIGGALVKKIDTTQVELEYSGKQVILK